MNKNSNHFSYFSRKRPRVLPGCFLLWHHQQVIHSVLAKRNFTVNVLLHFGLIDNEIRTSDGYQRVSFFLLFFDRKNVKSRFTATVCNQEWQPKIISCTTKMQLNSTETLVTSLSKSLLALMGWHHENGTKTFQCL